MLSTSSRMKQRQQGGRSRGRRRSRTGKGRIQASTRARAPLPDDGGGESIESDQRMAATAMSPNPAKSDGWGYCLESSSDPSPAGYFPHSRLPPISRSQVSASHGLLTCEGVQHHALCVSGGVEGPFLLQLDACQLSISTTLLQDNDASPQDQSGLITNSSIVARTSRHAVDGHSQDRLKIKLCCCQKERMPLLLHMPMKTWNASMIRMWS
ncbi:unnamed protein product [Urochloa humidicola]